MDSKALILNCRNCGHAFKGKYCPSCSQKKNDGRLYFKDLWHDAMYYIFSLDSPLSRTVKDLIVRPGKMVRDYVEGKRKAYYSPVKFFILAVAIFLILTAIFHFDPVAIEFKARGVTTQINYEANNYMRATYFMMQHINKFLFMWVFLFGLCCRLFYRKAKYNLTEYLALGFFVVSMYILLNTLAIFLTMISIYFIYLRYFLMLYMAWALMQFTGNYKVSSFFKASFVVILSFVIYAVTVFYISVMYVKMTH